jgi:hypothetical protein
VSVTPASQITATSVPSVPQVLFGAQFPANVSLFAVKTQFTRQLATLVFANLATDYFQEFASNAPTATSLPTDIA